MGQMTVEQWYGTIKTGLTKKLTENKEALPAGFNQQRFILNCITVIQDMMKDKRCTSCSCTLNISTKSPAREKRN